MRRWRAQFGEERILQEILEGREGGRCCEFGVRGMSNSNTANLVFNYDWYGQFLDLSPKNLESTERELVGNNGRGEVVCAEVTPKNVNDVLIKDIDVLSIDIDGNDYWVWRALKQRPEVVIIEINQRREKGVQKDDHKKRKGEGFGCSVGKMKALGRSKGYEFYRQSGVNLTFIRK